MRNCQGDRATKLLCGGYLQSEAVARLVPPSGFDRRSAANDRMDQSDLKFSIDTAVYKRVSTGEKVNGPVLEAYQPTQRNNAATTPRRHLWCATITPLCNATGGASDWGCGEDNQQRGALSNFGARFPISIRLIVTAQHRTCKKSRESSYGDGRPPLGNKPFMRYRINNDSTDKHGDKTTNMRIDWNTVEARN